MADPPIDQRHKPHFHRVAAVKEVCRVATTANVTIATALNAGDTLDGVTLATDDRVLVKNQSTGSQNGIYVVAATPVRAYDFSAADPRVQGCIVPVAAGTANASTAWQCTNTTTPTIDTTAITFAQLTGGGSGALDDLTDVTITSVADGEVLTYDSGSGDWVNAAPTTSGRWEHAVIPGSPPDDLYADGDWLYIFVP